MPSDIFISAARLHEYTRAACVAVGTPDDIAQQVATGLVGANLTGHDSHGVIRVPWYIDQARKGRLKPAARAAVTDGSRRGAVAWVDCAWGWGQNAAHEMTRVGIEIARHTGVSAVTIQNGNHIGRLGEYVEIIAQQGMIGLLQCNATPNVAAFGGRTRLFGTNPISIGAPRAAGKPPVVFDAATAAIAEGKLRVARDRGVPAPEGVILDKHGRPSTNPHDFYAGGVLLPFGEHKGYGISFMIEVLGGILSHKGPAPLPEYASNNGTLLIVIDPDFFVPQAQYLDQMERYCAAVKASALAEGYDEVLLPGEPELRSRAVREATGVPLPPATLDALNTLAQELGLAALS